MLRNSTLTTPIATYSPKALPPRDAAMTVPSPRRQKAPTDWLLASKRPPKVSRPRSGTPGCAGLHFPKIQHRGREAPSRRPHTQYEHGDTNQ